MKKFFKAIYHAMISYSEMRARVHMSSMGYYKRWE